MELLNIKNYVKKRKKSLKKYSKGASITIFQVRGNPASERYVRNKIVKPPRVSHFVTPLSFKDMNEVGIAHRLINIMISMCKKGVLHT